ncbi:hypothetical protein Y1Q_0006945 [Alligator mississippiensis]|uniref:Importin N-terminal domain-containing protein n=1 Tax=Alligator mississippiensis TaxID=8496 RepID=A0A151NVJ8_ALLMI|nr:hypothetical protein Y1Q_0006945 [Alligator mississippiensis]
MGRTGGNGLAPHGCSCRARRQTAIHGPLSQLTCQFPGLRDGFVPLPLLTGATGQGQNGPARPRAHLQLSPQALHQLYYDPSIENKNLAQKWLMQAQVSPQAWHFSWLLLNMDKVPEIQYFGASALHIKISRYWNDIPADQYESLKSQLFAQIARFAGGSKIVLTRLCVALASLALSMMPEAWPCAVADMVRMFQAEDTNVDGRARCLALLELLTVLPEEFQTSRLPQYRKGQVRSVLAQECGSVFPLLGQLLQQQDSPGFIKQKVLKCFSSWVQLEIPLMDCESLIQAAFASLQDPELFDTAVEAIVNAISQPDAQR